MSTADRNRDPRGIPTGGQFATGGRDEAEVSLDAATPYADWEPAEVDTELARLHEEQARCLQRWHSLHEHVNGSIARHVYGRGFRGRCSREEMDQTLTAMRQRVADGTPQRVDREVLRYHEQAEQHRAEAQEHGQAMVPLQEEFERRGGWTRAFLVSGSNGHVHKDMDCSTCFRPGFNDRTGEWREGTRFHWVTEMSDHTEDEIVDAAGERACTVCYPSAPVETLNKPTRLFTPEEQRKAAERAEREAAKVERDRKRIEKALTADGSEFVVTSRGYRERFKTEQAATTWAVGTLLDDRMGWYAMGEDTREGVEAVLDAIAAKHGMTGAEIDAMVEKKIAAKAKREGVTLPPR